MNDDRIPGLMCSNCTVRCTKIEELIDCFISTLEMRGFIKSRCNGFEKRLTCEHVYNSLKIYGNEKFDWIKDEIPFYSVK